MLPHCKEEIEAHQQASLSILFFFAKRMCLNFIISGSGMSWKYTTGDGWRRSNNLDNVQEEVGIGIDVIAVGVEKLGTNLWTSFEFDIQE